jgi:hypothetical protein
MGRAFAAIEQAAGRTSRALLRGVGTLRTTAGSASGVTGLGLVGAVAAHTAASVRRAVPIFDNTDVT